MAITFPAITGVGLDSLFSGTGLLQRTGTGAYSVTDAPSVSSLAVSGIAALGSVKSGVLYPAENSTTAVQIRKADGTTSVLNVDTTNSRLGLGTVSPVGDIDVRKESGLSSVVLDQGTNALGLIAGMSACAFQYSGAFGITSATRDSIVTSPGASGTFNLWISGYSGNVGLGTTGPNARLEALKTTEQLRLSYDSTHYSSCTVDASGALTLGGTLGTVVIGNQSALATSATAGFLHIPTCAGTPTGTPTSYTGKVPLVYDTTNNKLYAYNGGWKAMTAA